MGSKLLIAFIAVAAFGWCSFIQNQIIDLKKQNNTQDSLFQDLYYSVIDTFEKKAFLVTVTTYNATKNQCDESPDRTACNFKIDMNNPFKHRLIGLSRDLLENFYYGEKVILKNCGKFDGEYTVMDCGNKRLIRTVDILINRNMIGGKFENAVLIKK